MLLVNEWRYCAYQPLVKFVLVFLPVLAFLLAGDIEPQQAVRSLHMTLLVLIMLGLSVLMGLLTPLMLLRDSTANMTELIGSTPVSAKQRLLLRYIALVDLALLVLLLAYLAVFLAYSVAGGITVELLLHAIANFLLLAVPSVMFVAAISLWLCWRWPSSMVLYIWLGVWGIGYLLLASMAGSPILAGSSIISDEFYQAMLWLDPYGISPLLEGISADTVEFSQTLLCNRLFYLVLSVGMVMVAISKAQNPVAAKFVIRNDKSVAAVRVFQSDLMQLIATPLVVLVKNRMTQLILMVWPVMIFNEVASGSYYHQIAVASRLNSIDALNLVAFDFLPVFAAFVIALWSWFICWFDKRHGIEQLIGVMPVSNGQILAAQMIALSVMVVVLLLLTMLGSLVAQWFVGSEVMWSHYVLQLTLSGLPLLLLACLFIVIHHLCRSQVLAGGIILLILLIKFTAVMTAFGLTHTLWNIADSPLQAPDNYWGYGASWSVYWPYMVVWLLVTVSMGFVAVDGSHRGVALQRLNLKRLTKPALCSLVLAAVAGLSLHIALVAEKPLTNSHKRKAWQAQYQAAYGHWQYQPQPSIVAIDSKVDIYPNEQMAKFNLTYRLQNNTSEPISEILVGRYGNYAYGDIEINHAELSSFDEQLNQGIYQLKEALKPGQQTLMRAEFSYQQPRLWPYRSHQVVKPQFSYLRANPLLPVVGFHEDFLALENNKNITFRTVVSTVIDQYALSQGKLVEQWRQGQRAYYRYQTQAAISSMPTWLSLPHTPAIRQLDEVQLKMYAPVESDALEVHFDAMADTFNWFAAHIGPYPGDDLSVVAKPDVGTDGYGLEQIILINHSAGFRLPAIPNLLFDQRYRRTAYYSAAQWFVDKNDFWSRAIPSYIELLLIEENFGQAAMEQMVELAIVKLDRDLSNTLQAPVALVDDTSELAQYRATVAFAELRKIMGDEVIIATIKQLMDRANKVDGRDFVNGLKAQSGHRVDELIDSLLMR